MKHAILHSLSRVIRSLPQWVGVVALWGGLTISAQAQTATVEGTVTLPKPKTTTVPNDRYGLKTGQVAAAPAPVAVIYLEGQFAATTNAVTTNRVQMAQKGFQFTQAVLPVQKGSYVEFPNLDEDYHNVFSYSKTKRFDLGRYRKDEKPAAVLFDQPGLVKLYCEIHEHMRANVLVLDTPHFVTTTAEGGFKLPNLPPGKYVLKAWVDEKDVRSQTVELKAGETLKVDFKGP